MAKEIQMYTDESKTIKAYPKTKSECVYIDNNKTAKIKFDEIDSNIESINSSLESKAKQTDLDSANSKIITNTNDIAILRPQVQSLATGSPKGVYATVSALTNAFPTGNINIYIVSADGGWYYWNGSAWTKGGTYQATIIADGSIDKAKLDIGLKDKIIDLTQLANNLYMYNGVDVAKTVILTPTSAEITSNSTYAHFGFSVLNTIGNVYKTITTIENIGTINADIKMLVGYSDSSTNGGVQTNGENIAQGTLNVGSSKIIDIEFTSKNSKKYIALGVQCATNGAVLRIIQRVYDVTGLTTAFKSSLDWNNLVKYYFTSEYSKKSLASDTSTTANWALDGDFAKTVKEYKNISGDPNAIIGTRILYNGIIGGDYTNGVISGTPSASWGELLVYCDDSSIAINKKYLVTFLAKSDSDSSGRVHFFEYQGNTQLGASLTAINNLSTNWVRMSYEVTTTKTGVNKLLVGLNNAGSSPYAKLYMKDLMIIDIGTSPSLSDINIDSYGGVWTSYPNLASASKYAQTAQKAMSLDPSVILSSDSKWKNKNVLVMGDSLTAANQWQVKVGTVHNCNITTHAKGGIGITQVVDGSAPELAPLDSTKVTGKDLIILFIGMNERSTPFGVKGDLYPNQTTIWGKMQYAINKIYDCLTTANNLTCKLLIVTPHCPGKYQYVDVDGYGEYPVGSGQTLELLCNTLKTIGQYNNVPVVDLWHDSGISKRTWSIYTASPTATATIPATGTPYPNNADQLHLSTLGYNLIGEIIAGKMNYI